MFFGEKTDVIVFGNTEKETIVSKHLKSMYYMLASMYYMSWVVHKFNSFLDCEKDKCYKRKNSFF